MNLKLQLRTLSHHVTFFLGSRFEDAIPLVFVIGYPKSGTTWVCQVVADYLQLPFPRFSLLPVGCPAVVHGHQPVRRRYRRCIYVMRDGRDALVSHYFHLAGELPEGDHPKLTARQRRIFPGLVNKADVRANLPAFVARMMTHPQSTRLNWGDHVRSYYESDHPNAVLIRYEHLQRDGQAELARAMSELTGEPADPDRVRQSLDRFSFERQAGRKRGHEQQGSFLRKGLVGDWRNCFTRPAAEAFDRACGDMLVRAGYEPDHAWVESCDAAGDRTGRQAARGTRLAARAEP